MLLLAPGQGSQTPGLLTAWLALPGSAERVAAWSERCDLDLVRLGTTAEADEIRRTENAQPLLVAAALISGRAVLAGADPDLVCGHSIGELPALALAGVLDDEDAVMLAASRGRLMAEAAALAPTGMAALLGRVELSSLQDELAGSGLELATVNAPGQVVVGGPLTALQAWTPPPGVRVRLLEVAGAFHTAAMQTAVAPFAALVAGLAPGTARCGVVANADGAVLTDGQLLLDRLVGQLTRPVRFDLCLPAFASHDAVELAPAGVLTNLLKRALPELPVRAVRSPADLAVPAGSA